MTGGYMDKAGEPKEVNSVLNFCSSSASNHKNVIKAYIDKTPKQSKCRMRGEKDETVNHSASAYSKVQQKEHKRMYDWVGRRVHWDACKKYDIRLKNKRHALKCLIAVPPAN